MSQKPKNLKMKNEKPKNNKNAFQLKAHLPLADRKSNTYNSTLDWPWPWDDLDLRQVKLS